MFNILSHIGKKLAKFYSANRALQPEFNIVIAAQAIACETKQNARKFKMKLTTLNQVYI